MTPALCPDTPADLEPPTPTFPSRWDSLSALSARLERQLARNRRRAEQTTLFWIEMDALEPPTGACTNTPRTELAHALGARLMRRVRRTDEVFQVGERHFAVLLDTDLKGAELVERRLHEQARKPCGVEGWHSIVRLHVGAATLAEARRRGHTLAAAALADWQHRLAASAQTC